MNEKVGVLLRQRLSHGPPSGQIVIVDVTTSDESKSVRNRVAGGLECLFNAPSSVVYGVMDGCRRLNRGKGVIIEISGIIRALGSSKCSLFVQVRIPPADTVSRAIALPGNSQPGQWTCCPVPRGNGRIRSCLLQ